MKKIISSFRFVLPILLIASFLFTSAPDVSAAVIMSTDSFGSSDTDDVPGWVDGGGPGTDDASDSRVENDSPRSGSLTSHHARVGDGGHITKTISTAGFNTIVLKYYWRGDDDGDGSSDNLKVYWKKTSDSTFLLLNTHQMDNNDSWSSQVSVSLPAAANNTSIDIRFEGDSNHDDDEEGRVDDVSLEGATIVKTNPTLSISNSPVTYNGASQSATVSGSVGGVVTDIKYNGSSTVPTNAGTYAVTADFVPTDTTNYNNLNDASAGNFVINKADANIDVDGFSGTYDGTPHGMTGSAIGVLDEALSGLALSPTTFTDVSVNTLNWTFTDVTGNYNDANGSVDIEILPLELTAVATGISKIYNADTLTHKLSLERKVLFLGMT